jgi:hypothetical protein
MKTPISTHEQTKAIKGYKGGTPVVMIDLLKFGEVANRG